MILAPDELAALTGRARPSAQARALRAMGIEHRTRPDGSLAVSRAHVEAVLGGERGARATREVVPNWGAI